VKTLKFIGASQGDLAAFPELAKRQAGFELWPLIWPLQTDRSMNHD